MDVLRSTWRHVALLWLHGMCVHTCTADQWRAWGRVYMPEQGYSALEPEDFHNASISSSIARQMGHMHRLAVSGSREAVVWRTLRKWMALVGDVRFDVVDQAMLDSLNPVRIGHPRSHMPALCVLASFLTTCGSRYMGVL